MKGHRAAFLHSTELEKYGYPDHCPFNTSRAAKARKTVYTMGLLGGSDRREVAPVQATVAELERFHLASYLDALQRASQGELDGESFQMGLGTPDCPIFLGMYDYASFAAGATLTGARLILSGEADVAFNPSGGYHHAGAGYCAGFCYINDIVLGALEFVRAGKRVLFLDLDVHHCDGVQDAFFDRADVMTISLHESGRTLFPGSGYEEEIGAGAGEGYTVNIPLPVGTYDAAYLRAFEGVALPLIKAYKPDVLIVEAGMDGLAGDPLAHLHLTNNVYADILSQIMELDCPLLVTGGGGYNIENTARGWALLWSVLCGDRSDEAMFGLGGVMLGNTDWSGGLRDRVLLSDAGCRDQVDRSIEETLAKLRRLVFPIHGLT